MQQLKPLLENDITAQMPIAGSQPLTRTAIAIFAFVVAAWGLNWVVMKVIVEQVTPLCRDTLG